VPEAVKTISLFHNTEAAYNVSTIFHSKVKKKFLRRGNGPSHKPLPVRSEKTPPHTPPLGAFRVI